MHSYGTAGSWVTHLQNAISVAFLADYVLRIYSEPARIFYIFSLSGLVDLLSAIPIFNVFRYRKAGGDVYNLLQFLRIVRISSCITKLGMAGSTLTQQIILLIFSTAGAVVLVAGIIQWLEYHGASEKTKRMCPREGCMSFWDAFYFVIVTIATVGYGDVVPVTIQGQAAIIITIMIAVAILPIQVSRISTLAYNRPYGGTFNSRKVLGSRFLIIGGSIELRVIQIFLAELYNPTHAEDLEIYPMHVIILAPFTPSFELQQLLSLYNNQVEFYEGCPSQTSDLDRISADKASAFFLLADKETLDPRTEDHTQIFRALAVSRYCKGRVRIVVEVLDPDALRCSVWDNAYGQGIEVICQTKLHNKLLARSCTIKGLYTFITNLFTSEIQLHNIPSMRHIVEYNHSFDNEVYPLIFPSAFHGLLFEEVTEFIYSSFNITLFALDTSGTVLLHPKGHSISSNDIGLVMATSLNTVYSISKFEGTCSNPQSRERKLLESVSSRWKKLGSVASFKRQEIPGIDSYLDGSQPVPVPSSPVGHHKLIVSLRDAVEKNHAALLSGNGFSDSTEIDASTSNYLEGEPSAALEASMDWTLAWPSADIYGRPHAVLLERNEQKILQDLQRRSITIVSLKKAHILVCCQGKWPANLFYFLVELRKPTFPNHPVVILHPSQPDFYQWGSVGVFKDVFFVKGSPIHELDLMRAGVIHADKVIVLAYPGCPIDASGKGVQQTADTRKNPGAYTSDVDGIIILANIERLLHGDLTKVVIEMQHAIGLHYLWPYSQIPSGSIPADAYKRNPDAVAHFAPAYMEGRAVSPSMLSFLMRSSFYNKNTSSIVEQLVEGSVDDSKHARVLEQFEAPQKYVNRSYGDMFSELLAERGMLALGLYRAKGTHGSPCPYVFTNPPMDSIVSAEDLVFALI
ncbi:calcium-activated potassium channel subunit alpha-1-like isoform X1 [Selaginella moellendorffii]|uniref:calcium-activated potassium channel subunit alpha-1-like isoform X1 n=1 Tax=Selaginella moellendorffii TaxID=88036 RepID=UPI000D1C2195|nr:calcium-activated potassium channel subunit alpha-1-like isoform X1 [Selaginella moellendorffii]|eukprot:XP_024521187.1 calcium-activated potassium channel subunit alpha-1-like isoform X1 [Selaginella moellendorffii]